MFVKRSAAITPRVASRRTPWQLTQDLWDRERTTRAFDCWSRRSPITPSTCSTRTGIVASWNPGAQRFKGYTADEIIGQHFSRFYTEEDRAAGAARTRAARPPSARAVSSSEGWRVRKDGTRFWAHVVIDPIRDESGKLIGFAKITRDITESARPTEDALRESEERFRLLVQGVTDYAIYMLDPEGSVTNWNAGAQRIKGYTDARDRRPAFLALLHRGGPRGGAARASAARPPRAKAASRTEGWRVRKDGTPLLGARRHRRHPRRRRAS